MTATDIAAVIGVPLFIFIAGAIYGGIRLLLKGSQYMTRSAAAQESTAKSNNEINDTLKVYMAKNDERVNDHERRLFVLEDARHRSEDKGQP